MKNGNERNESQIIRKDGKGCFVEVKNDCFAFGKIHLQFIKYDVNRPTGDRYTDNINIYIDVAEFFVLAYETVSGILYAKAKKFEADKNKSPLFQSMGGTAAKKLTQSRADGKSLSRVFTISPSNIGYFLTATSGPGEEDAKGLIVPKFGNNPENRVSVPISHSDVSELMLIAKTHYEAWLAAQYTRNWKPEEKNDKAVQPHQDNNRLSNGSQNGSADGSLNGSAGVSQSGSEIGSPNADDMKMF